MSSSASRTNEQALANAIARAKTGDHDAARALLRQIVGADPQEARAWMWLVQVARTDEERRAALRRAALLRPEDARLTEALRGLLDAAHVKQAASSGVYVSYSRPDELFAAELADTLRGAGVAVWLDTTDIPEDADWNAEVQAALKRCGVLLAVMSPDAVADDDLTQERQRFVDAGKIAVPLLYRTCELTGFVHPTLDFRRDKSIGMHSLVRLLR